MPSPKPDIQAGQQHQHQPDESCCSPAIASFGSLRKSESEDVSGGAQRHGGGAAESGSGRMIVGRERSRSRSGSAPDSSSGSGSKTGPTGLQAINPMPTATIHPSGPTCSSSNASSPPPAPTSNTSNESSRQPDPPTLPTTGSIRPNAHEELLDSPPTARSSVRRRERVRARASGGDQSSGEAEDERVDERFQTGSTPSDESSPTARKEQKDDPSSQSDPPSIPARPFPGVGGGSQTSRRRTRTTSTRNATRPTTSRTASSKNNNNVLAHPRPDYEIDRRTDGALNARQGLGVTLGVTSTEAEDERVRVAGVSGSASVAGTGTGTDTTGKGNGNGNGNGKVSGKGKAMAPRTEDDWCDLLANYVSQNLLIRSNFFRHDFSSAAYRTPGGSHAASGSRTRSGTAKVKPKGGKGRNSPMASALQTGSVGVFSPTLDDPGVSSFGSSNPLSTSVQIGSGEGGRSASGGGNTDSLQATGVDGTSPSSENPHQPAPSSPRPENVFWSAPYGPGDLSRAHSGQARIESADLRKNSIEAGGVGAGTGIERYEETSAKVEGSRPGSSRSTSKASPDISSMAEIARGNDARPPSSRDTASSPPEGYFDDAIVPASITTEAVNAADDNMEDATPHVNDTGHASSVGVDAKQVGGVGSAQVPSVHVPGISQDASIDAPPGVAAEPKPIDLASPPVKSFDYINATMSGVSDGSGGSSGTGVDRLSVAMRQGPDAASRNSSDFQSKQGDHGNEVVSDPWTRANARVATNEADIAASKAKTDGVALPGPPEENYQDPQIPDMASASQEQPIDAYNRQRRRSPPATQESAKSRRNLAKHLGQPEAGPVKRRSGDRVPVIDKSTRSVAGTAQNTIRGAGSEAAVSRTIRADIRMPSREVTDPPMHSVAPERPALTALQRESTRDVTLRPADPMLRKPLKTRTSFAPSAVGPADDGSQHSGLMASSAGTSSPPQSPQLSNKARLSSRARLDKYREEAQHIKAFFDTQGFMPAPQQSPETRRRRLRTIRRLGLDADGDAVHRSTLDRFTRLACSIFKAKMATVTIVGQDSQLFPSEIGLDVRTMGLELGFCTHTSLSEREAMIVPDAAEDWRFRNHPMVQNGTGPIRFYAGAPLTFGEGSKTCTIGTLCVIDDKPRYTWSSHDSAVLIDLASCVLGDMELMFEERQRELRSVMHQVTVDFLRQSLRAPPARRQIRERSRNHPSTDAGTADLESFKEGADTRTGSSLRESVTTGDANGGVDLYQEACNVIMHTLNAHAVAIVDLSRFHIYFPSVQEDGVPTERGTATGTGTSTTGASRTNSTRNSAAAYTSYMSSEAQSATSSSSDPNRARPLHGNDNRKIPIVEFVRRTNRTPGSAPSDELQAEKVQDFDPIHVLGQSYSGSELEFNFNTSTAHRTISNFIAQHLATRRVWYERNDSPLIAASLTAMMPRGTEVSLTLPVFDFQGQAAFCVAVCWSDPLYTYDKAAIGFVENISGSLLANTLRTRLSNIEQSQRAFAAFASHQWRTPLHQMMTTTSLMRQLIAQTPPATPGTGRGEYFDRPQTAQQIQVAQKNQELALMLDTLESSGKSLQDTLGDIIDFLDVGTDSSGKQFDGDAATKTNEGETMEMDVLMTDAILSAQSAEMMLRNATGRDARRLETICEVVPRSTGDWMILRDFGPLKRACNKIIANSYAATTSGYVSVTVEDVTHRATIPLGYDRMLTKSIVRVTIEDSGSGMNGDFADKEIFRAFAKEDRFSPGSGLGVTLTQRILILMGGVIRFTTQPGKGTTCIIEVPLYIQDLPDSTSDGLTPGDGLPPIAVLGFDGQSDVGLTRVNDSLKRQLRAGGCEVVAHFDGASIFVCEEGYDVLAAHPALRQRDPADIKVIMVGSAVSPRKICLDNPTKLGNTKISVSWLFRPLLPILIEKILAIARTSALKDETEKEQILPSPRLDPHSAESSDNDIPVADLPVQLVTHYREAPTPLPDLAEEPVPRSEDGAITTSPIAADTASSGAADVERPERDSAEQPVFKVLVVEDNPVNRRLLVGMIKRMKITCFEAVDGAQAVTQYVESRPSLVLLDINMPIKNGFEAASDIRKHERQHVWPRCKIIAVTALSAERDRRRGMIESGIDDWVTKPVGVQNLRSSIEALRATRGKMDQDDVEEAEGRAKGEGKG